MKKMIGMLLALVMIVGVCGSAMADSELESKLAGITLETIRADSSDYEKQLMDRSLAVTTDTVTLTEENVSVVIEDGVEFCYQYPSEYVLCLTQDIMQQSYLYLCWYPNNMNGMAEKFINDGMHLNIYDQDTDTDIYISSGLTKLSTLIQDLASLSEEDVLVIEQLVSTNQNYFSEAQSVTTGTIGGNLWIFADYGTYGFLLTFVNGNEIVCDFRYKDEKGPVTALTLLNNLSVTAA